MNYGYMGKICFVDLSKGTIKEENLEDEIYRNVIGGEGLGAWILHTRQFAGQDPLGPKNIIGFTTGLLTGCGVPSSSRSMVVTKSPLTGTWGDSNVGGYFGPELKACGYDAVFFKGLSPKPVFLLLTDEKVELRDASHLWGKDTVETSNILRKEFGDFKIKIASIGPAGEKLSLISSIIMDGRTAARSGVGAVMGSKQLKAIVVSGKKKVHVANFEDIKAMAKSYRKILRNTDYFVIKSLREYGTCGLVSVGTVAGIAPAKNWNLNGEEGFPTHAKLDSDSVIKYREKKHGCSGCVISCGGIAKINSGPFKGLETRLPEYETLISFGNMCLNDDIESILKAEDLCDRYGIDTISTGSAIAFAIECFEEGIIDKNDTEGIELTWGNKSAILCILEQIVKREGFGAVLSDGVKRATEKIGRGSEKFAIHINGQELPYHDFRYELSGRGTSYISDSTPSRHERSSGSQYLEMGKSLGPYPELQPIPLKNNKYKNKGKIYALGAKYFEAYVACGMCALTMFACNTLPLVEFVSAATGWDFSAAELLEVGERILTLRQNFNFKEGVRPGDLNLPDRLKHPPIFQGPMKRDGINYNFKKLRKAYFSEMKWDPITGEPVKEKLNQLGIEGIVS